MKYEAVVSIVVRNTQQRTASVLTQHGTLKTMYHSQNNFIDDDSTPLILLMLLISTIFLQKRKTLNKINIDITH